MGGNAENRTIHELLLISHLYFDTYFNSGLCALFRRLLGYSIITKTELYILLTYLKAHKTSNLYEGYYWPVGQKQPRINWLRTHITRIS